MSVSEPEQAEPVQSERRMSITGCACDIGEAYEEGVIGQDLSKANENKQLAEKPVCFFRNYFFAGIIRMEQIHSDCHSGPSLLPNIFGGLCAE